MLTTKQWHLASRPTGKPTRENFEMVTTEIPGPTPGQILVKTLYQSVDPYMRPCLTEGGTHSTWELGEPMEADIVGEVIESEADEFETGDVVIARSLWSEHTVIDAEAFRSSVKMRRVDPELAPVSTALGVLGSGGTTAYFGLIDKGEPEPGDTVVVSAAAGSIGSVVGQLARIAGARVVGIAGSDEKIAWLTEELGFDAAINYRTTDTLTGALEAVCSDGVDIYFDNVGGAITDSVWPLLNDNARVPVCGQVALYNETETPVGPRKLGSLIATCARVEGFRSGNYTTEEWQAVIRRLAAFIHSGELRYREDVADGFETAPSAFIGLFEGENIGKQLVKVGERE